jgi:hypothetical protein
MGYPSARKRELLIELSKLVLDEPGPSAYLSALYDEGTEEEIAREIEERKACQRNSEGSTC